MTDTPPVVSAKNRPALGRGLNALFGDVAREQPVASGAEPSAGLRMVAVGALSPHPSQPRRHFDEAALDELAGSIAERGLIQPIVVRPMGQGFQIVAGERRWRAAQRARLHEVPVIIRDFNDAQTLEIALVENIQREDLNAIEEAEAYTRLIVDYGHTQEALGKIVHKSRSHIANLMRLLELPAAVQARVAEGALSMGHARALIGAADVERLAADVVARGLSVRETERLARAAKPARRGDAARVSLVTDHDILALERQLADILGISVKIQHGAKGGALTLGYSTLEQLDMICQRLSGERG
ncbi:MAG: ParB/RepB/Spo0J family partition protein [Sphingomonas sp.]